MENKQSSIKIIANNFQDSYKRFFSEITTEANQQVVVQPQMPAFQQTLFLQQAQTRHLLVQLQLNPRNLQNDVKNITGYLSAGPTGDLLLTEPSNRVIHMIALSQIRYIARAN